MAASTFTAQTFDDASSEFNAHNFHILQLIGKIKTITLVEVMPFIDNQIPGTVNVRPMVHMMAGNDTAIEHATIYNIPYFRLQAGENAVIINPQVGDIGACGFCDRDISVVKKTKKASQPGSWRQYDYADGLYFGGMMLLNKTPTQFIRFDTDGITVTSPIAATINAPTLTANISEKIELNSPEMIANIDKVTFNSSTIDLTGVVRANGVVIDETHTHEDVYPGSGISGQVTG
ncbi:MAG: hypothetical protein WC714_28660 [Candidatus Obscuribacterales bacterium]|jgi:hypothetical protein